MAFKNIFDAMKREGYIVGDLEKFLIGYANRENDRAINVNAPSQVGKCLRARYYARTSVPSDPNSISARAQRIFDNGTGVHERLQGYLKEMGKLVMDELPVYNEQYNIQGHTDGLFVIEKGDEKYPKEVGVLEIKSINSRGFTELKDAKPEHKMQGLVYLYCLEERRKYLKEHYKTALKFIRDASKRNEEYKSLYSHIKDGNKHTREDKINYQCELHKFLDSILIHLEKPITTAVFLYECKDNQELKEFVVTTKEPESEFFIRKFLKEYSLLNEYVKNKEIPPRCSSSKTTDACRWCDYKITCWN